MIQQPDVRARRLPFAFADLDPSVRRDVVYLEATDTAQSFGILYRPPTTIRRPPSTSCTRAASSRATTSSPG